MIYRGYDTGGYQYQSDNLSTDVHFQVTRINTDDVSAVHLHHGEYVAVGSAKRHPKDAPDTTLGGNLAMARALANLSNQLYADVNTSIEKGI